MLAVNANESIIDYLASLLSSKLQAGKSVLWLLSGGDAIKAQVDISQKLQTVDTSRLIVALMDERYGEVGHSDENWQQLLDAGFSLPHATDYRILTGRNRYETAQQFAAFLNDALQRVDYSIGLFGVGTDGHTAGIKVRSPAVYENELVSEYEGDDYERITITPRAIQLLDEAILYVEGVAADKQVEKLLRTTAPTEEQPVQILKDVPKSTLFIAR